MLKRSAALSQTTWKEEREGFSWNNIVVLCALGLQPLRLLSREARGIRLSRGTVLVSFLILMASCTV